MSNFIFVNKSTENEITINNSIFEYIRKENNGNNQKIGLIMTAIIDGEVCFGWSLCKVTEEKFNRDVAFAMAINRMLNNERYEKYLLYNYKDIDFNANDVPFDDDDFLDNIDNDVHFIDVDFIDDILPFTIKNNMKRFIGRVDAYYKNEPVTEVLEYLKTNILF